MAWAELDRLSLSDLLDMHDVVQAVDAAKRRAAERAEQTRG